MSYEVFDLSEIISRMECTKGVTFNGREIISCFPKCNYEPRDIYDDPYWEEPLIYNITLRTQYMLGFPLIKKEVPTVSTKMFAAELARIRYDLLDINNYLREYKKIYHIGLMAHLPLKILNEACTRESFKYFKVEDSLGEVKYMLEDDNHVTLKVTPEVSKSLVIVEDILGHYNSLDIMNTDYFSRLPIPKNLEEIADDSTINQNIKFHNKVSKINDTIFYEYKVKLQHDTDSLL